MQIRIVVASIVASAVVLGTSIPAGSSSKPSYEGPGLRHTEYVSVTPSSNLKSGETVMVQGFGFKANLTVAFNMCTLEVRGYNDCDPSTTKLPSAHVSSAGTFGPRPFVVSQLIHIPAERNAALMCERDNCSIGVGDPSGLTAGSHCVSFTSSECAPAPHDHFVSRP